MTVLLWRAQGLDPSWYGGKVSGHQAEVALRDEQGQVLPLTALHILFLEQRHTQTHTNMHLKFHFNCNIMLNRLRFYL